MCLYEYDEEKHMEMERKEHYARGLADGRAEGREEAVAHGIHVLINHCRKLKQTDMEILQVLMEEYELSEEEAKKFLESM